MSRARRRANRDQELREMEQMAQQRAASPELTEDRPDVGMINLLE